MILKIWRLWRQKVNFMMNENDLAVFSGKYGISVLSAAGEVKIDIFKRSDLGGIKIQFH